MKVNYIKLLESALEIEKCTDKAYAICVGMSAKIGKYGESISKVVYVAKSICKCADGNIYLPVWLVNKNNLWNNVDKNIIIKIENGKKRQTKEEKLINDIRRIFDIESSKKDIIGLQFVNLELKPSVINAKTIDKKLKKQENDENYLDNIDAIGIVKIDLKNKIIFSYAFNNEKLQDIVIQRITSAF